MYEVFIRNRITELRLQKGVSEYKMSKDMGHSKSYMQSISSGRALPSLTEFIYMFEYFGVTPSQFFDTESKNTLLINQILDETKDMTNDDLLAILEVAKRISNNKK